jgi:gliding motility-associated-like protein
MKVKIVLLNLFFMPFGYQSQVVINEVMHKPATSASVNQGFAKKEYVEIFNSSCSPVDISCWIIGSSAPLTGTTPYWCGAYQFSAGTIIAPGQHLVLGGTNSDNGTAYNTADIDFNVNVPGNSCVTGTGGWLLPNGDGWVALYNNSGVVQDAVYWSLSANPNLNTDADFSTNPCVPSTGCAPVASLMSCRQINQNYPSRLSYGGLSTSFDLTFSRVPDGGAWQRDIPSSITGNQCNNGQCATISAFTLSAATVQPSCGQSNGSITITPSPAGTYTYAWSPNSSTASSATGLSAGTYTVTATNASGCQSSTTVALTSSGGISAIAVSTVNPTCGGSNGSVTLGAVTGGTAPYQYNFNGTGLGSNTSFTNLSSGTYTLTVQDNAGCTYSAPSVVLSNGSGPSAVVVNATNTSCGQNNGAVSIGAVTGGTGPYQFNFNNTGFSSTTSYPNLSAGSYTLTVQDNSGCTFSAPGIVISSSSAPTAIAVTPTNPLCGQTNGSVSLGSVTGGVSPYQYNFNGAGYATTLNYNNLGVGNYTLTVQDNAGCTYSAPLINLSSNGGPSGVVVSSTNPSCSSSDGTVSIGAVTGGTAPYQFNFNGMGYGTNVDFSNLTSGTYTLNVQDNTGCVYSAPSIVLTAANSPTAITVSTTPENCNQSNGSVSLGTVTGGLAPYQFNFNGGGYSSTINFTNLASGNYTLSVQDNSGCVYNAPVVVVSEIAGPNALVVTANNASCGNANGSVVLGTVTGGTAPYQYNFNNSGYSNTTNYSNLNTGNYTVSVQDNAGCIYTAANAVITNTASPTGIAQTINDASCGLQNGSVVLGSVTGGTAPYQYNFNGQGYSSTTTFSGLNGGSYSLIVQDALGCTYAAPAIVLSTSVGPTIINFNSVNASCDQNNGSIQIVSITGGTAPYQYSFNGSAMTTTTSYPNLVPGAYQLSVLDASGCTIQTQVQISGGSSPIADFAINPSAISIYDPYANLINLSSSDVVLNSWSIPNGEPNSSNSEDLQISFLDSEPGTYPITLIVTNADGCTDTVVKTIEVFAEIIVFAPNSFTPDGDEYNNDWKIYVSNADLTSFKLQIYNRWGELVFESFDSEVGWDGTYNGVYVQDGTYSWIMTIKDLRNDNFYKYLGHINKIQ